MTTAVRCYTPIQGRVLRVVLLDACGLPVSGASDNQVVIDGFTQVAQAAQYETIEEQIVVTAGNQLCVNEPPKDILKRLELTIDLCQINPAVPALMGVVRLLTASESPSGTGFALPEGGSEEHFSIEVWQLAAGAAACGPGGAQQYVYNAWPHLVNPRIGDYAIASAPSTLQLLAASRTVNSGWAVGDPWLGTGAVTVIPDHWFQNLTTEPPPDVVCRLDNYVPVP